MSRRCQAGNWLYECGTRGRELPWPCRNKFAKPLCKAVCSDDITLQRNVGVVEKKP